MQVEQFQAIIIGSGQGGGPLATDLAEAGWKTALIEKGNPGGTCVNRGCTPTKTVAASARVAHLVSRAGEFGVRTGPVVIDLPAILNRKDDVVELFRKSVKKSFKNVENLTFISGEARFTGETRGKMKVVIDAKTDCILGCAILAPEGGEVMSALQMAMMGELPFTEIRDGVFAHPTMTESLNNLFETV